MSVFFGGLSIKKDEEVLKRNCPHVGVGTPGRILALVRNRSLNLKNVKHFVLDECDKMLEQLGIYDKPDTRLLICEVPHDHPFVMVEQLMPILPIIRCVLRKSAAAWS